MSVFRARERAVWMASIALLAGMSTLGAGCRGGGAQGESGPRLHDPRPSDGSAAGDYEAGLYASAYTKATKEAGATSGARHERAALIAGMSAHALDRNADAEHWLGPLTMSKDKEIAGRASATLGLIEQERGRHARAAQLLNEAADKLSGDEAYRARSAAAMSSRAMEGGGSGGRIAGPAGTLGPFTLQLGAFSSRANADKMASTSSASARRAGLGEPQVSVDQDSKGRSLWVVRVGSFPSRAAAMRGQRTFSKSVVVQTGGGRTAAGVGR